MSDLRLGEPMIYVPVLQSAADYDGRPMPLGYERVDELGPCPICTRQEQNSCD